MKFYVTVGVQYARDEHPVGLHPDGVLEVVAPDEAAARGMVVGLLGDRWAFMYREDEVDWKWHPRGVTHRLIFTEA